MRAIVLTYDRNRPLTEHMILKYERLWAGNPFVFTIPVQEQTSLNARMRSPHRTVPADPAIKRTVLTLLSGIHDDEWIFWCIDDKYPIRLDVVRIEQVMQWALRSEPDDCSGVLFCRARKLLRDEFLRDTPREDAHGNVYLRRRDYSQIWVHQFLRAKVIRHLFERFPDDIPEAKAMDGLKNGLDLPESHALFVTAENHAVFGESTSRGKLTMNCYESLREQGLPLRGLAVDDSRRIILGR